MTPIPLKHHRRITSPCQNIACRQYVFVLDLLYKDLDLNQGLVHDPDPSYYSRRVLTGQKFIPVKTGF